MNKTNQWLTALTNLGVLAGLIFLGVELKQNREFAKFEATQASRNQRIEHFRSLRDSPYMPSIFVKLSEGKQLSLEEQIRLNNQHSMHWGLLYSEWIQREIGTAGEFDTKGDGSIRLALTNPSTRDWWDRLGNRIYPKSLSITSNLKKHTDAKCLGAPERA